MSESVALVTGGNRGLGFETARKLAARGFHVILTARKEAEGEAAVASILAAHPSARAQSLVLDLASLASVRACADAFHALHLPLNLLVNNAGVMRTDTRPAFTEDGFERTLGTNHVGPFLLTHLLMPDLVEAAPSRIVVVSSAMHRAGQGPGPGPDFDYGNLKAEKSFHPVAAYRNSKLANLWFVSELAPRAAKQNVCVVAVSPGWVPETQAGQQSSGVARFLFRRVLPHLPFCRTVAEGSDNTVFAATDPAVQSSSGTFYEDRKPGVLSDEAKDAALARRAWEATCSWAGVREWGAA